jgi:hypothetical protein
VRPDGPSLEKFTAEGASVAVRCLWLIPITGAERDFQRANGLESLERKFEAANLNYVDPLRLSVV